jgi:Kef-type K+ transport system membrane component KefB
MYFIVRPFARRLESLHERQGRLSQGVMATVLLLALVSACVTQWIGIHALFGAFLMGAMMPKGTRFVREISEKIEDYTVILLLPIFFAYSGLRTQVGLLNTPGLWFDAGLITVVACLGKFGGSSLAARVCGLPWRDASAIGILMNTRGLMELVILNIGRDLGVISEAVFAMMILMALITTSLTQPVLNLIYPVRLVTAQLGKRSGGTFSDTTRPAEACRRNDLLSQRRHLARCRRNRSQPRCGPGPDGFSQAGLRASASGRQGAPDHGRLPV